MEHIRWAFRETFRSDYYQCIKKPSPQGGYPKSLWTYNSICHGPYQTFDEAFKAMYFNKEIHENSLDTVIEVLHFWPQSIVRQLLIFKDHPKETQIIDKHNI